MKKMFKNLICHLYYKYCYRQEALAQHIATWYMPCIMKDGTPITGTYIFGIINERIASENFELWNPPAGTKRGVIQPLASFNFNVEPFSKTEETT